jgi:hypothetical protein
MEKFLFFLKDIAKLVNLTIKSEEKESITISKDKRN